jgi:hypothetical protein
MMEPATQNNFTLSAVFFHHRGKGGELSERFAPCCLAVPRTAFAGESAWEWFNRSQAQLIFRLRRFGGLGSRLLSRSPEGYLTTGAVGDTFLDPPAFFGG